MGRLTVVEHWASKERVMVESVGQRLDGHVVRSEWVVGISVVFHSGILETVHSVWEVVPPADVHGEGVEV